MRTYHRYNIIRARNLQEAMPGGVEVCRTGPEARRASRVCALQLADVDTPLALQRHQPEPARDGREGVDHLLVRFAFHHADDNLGLPIPGSSFRKVSAKAAAPPGLWQTSRDRRGGDRSPVLIWKRPAQIGVLYTLLDSRFRADFIPCLRKASAAFNTSAAFLQLVRTFQRRAQSLEKCEFVGRDNPGSTFRDQPHSPLSRSGMQRRLPIAADTPRSPARPRAGAGRSDAGHPA